ncbi:uncharacterized protein LOC144527959 isoform X3 [Sander vitreus]
MSDISEEQWKKTLTSIMEELEDLQYTKTLECLEKIPKGQKSSTPREKMPGKIIEHYGLLVSISEIDKAMDYIPRRDPKIQDLLRPFVDELRNEQEIKNQGKKRKREQDGKEVLREDQPKILNQQESSQPDKERNIPFWIDPVTKTKVKGERKLTKKQRFQLKDETDSIEIVMWRDATEQCKGLSVGDVVKVTNMKINEYFGKISLNSTGNTRIEKVQSVSIQKGPIEIIGIIKATQKETQLEANFNDNLQTFVVASRLLAKTLNFKIKGDIKKSLIDKIPISADAEIQGNQITKITAA